MERARGECQTQLQQQTAGAEGKTASAEKNPTKTAKTPKNMNWKEFPGLNEEEDVLNVVSILKILVIY